VKTVDEHLAEVLALVSPLPPLDLQLLDAHGRTLLEDVVAPYDLPGFDNSAMDGYAVRLTDVTAAAEGSPVTMPVTGDIAAGSRSSYALGPGFTARIMTGAPMPRHADAVVPVEWTDGGIARVQIRRAPSLGEHIRRAGSDLRAGEVVLKRDTVLGPTQIGLLAAIGRDRVLIQPQPRVVVLSTGDELVEPGQPIGMGQVADANSYMLACAAREAGAVVYRAGIVGDDARKLMNVLEDQLIRADLVITTGGVSKGAYDVVKEVLSRLGTVVFDEVAMQPGKPQGFGTIGPENTPIVTLPGNPVSSYVSFEVFVRPALRRLGGRPEAEQFRPLVSARSTAAMTSAAGRRQFVRVRADRRAEGWASTPVGGHGSHLIGSLAHANAFAVIPEHVVEVPSGGMVDVMLLEQDPAGR
jgi:molybdopterin molybdotransferase